MINSDPLVNKQSPLTPVGLIMISQSPVPQVFLACSSTRLQPGTIQRENQYSFLFIARTNSRCWASSKSSKEHGLATGADRLTRLLHPKPSSSRLAKVSSLSKVALLLNLEWVGKALTSWSVRRRAAGICNQVEFKQLSFHLDTKYRQKRNVNWNKPCRIRGFKSLSNARFEKA
jgi:hypothetical protein